MTSSTQPAPALRVVALMPVRDDWTSAAELLRQLDRMVHPLGCALDVVLMDDASTQLHTESPLCAARASYSAIESIRVVRLRRNLGHQRAIALGLVYVDRNMACDAVLVMDADGEDTAEGASQLIRAFASEGSRGGAVFAERSRRTESLVFRVFYVIYKVLHLALTGVGVKVGNFSILPRRYLSTLVVMSELWNHYAAAFFRSGLRYTTVPIPRGHRISGSSRMNFVSLTAHGMSAISVFGDVVGVRLLIVAMAGVVLAAMGIVAVTAIRMFTEYAIPGWATYSAGLLFVILFQFIILATTFTFTLLSNRINLTFVPLRDHELFLDSAETVYPHE
jgi:cellulose synthase/poly-beta-1,6-N-acetylglucosamine synthase-like glycosyltransferase